MRKYALLLVVMATSLFLFGCAEKNPASPDMAVTDLAATGAEKSLTEAGAANATYEIIVENLTPATGPGASQPFSPPILATHRGNMHVFEAGKYASSALSMVAEDAIGGPLLEMLNGSDRVHGVAAGDGVVFPGSETRLEIEARPGFWSLSLVFMLVNTNDAFGGLDGVKLPTHGEMTYMVHAWDAGSELNTELMTDIPGPCCGSPGMGTDEEKVISHHMGIMGTGDLAAATYGWEGPVARVTVRRID